MQSEGTLATAAEMSQQKILDFSCVDNDQVISQPANSYVFRTYDPFSLQATAYFKWLLTQYPDAKTVGLITTNSDNGLAIEDQEKAGAQANGLTFLDTVLYDSGTKDFTPFLTKMLAEKPDILTFTGAPTGDCAVLVKTAFDMGYKGHIALSTDAASDMLPIAGEAALEGVTDTNLAMQAPYVTSTVLGLPAREVAKWGASYVSTWDFYSQALIMFDAMKAANSVDTTAVKTILQDPTREWTYAALSGGLATFDSPMAQQWFGANATNQILDAWAICKIHNGQDFIATIINP
jgi:ABC-type branched-subunit amino acid transport system substrate-binding protein